MRPARAQIRKSQGISVNGVTSRSSCAPTSKRPHWLRTAIGRALLWFIAPIQDERDKARNVNRADLQRLLDERDAELRRRIPSIMIDKNRRRGLGGDFV